MASTIFSELLKDPEASPVRGPAAADAAQMYGSIADRITQMLNQGTQPSLQDIGTALLRNAGGAQTYGQAISELTQQRQQQAMQGIQLTMTAADALLKQSELQAQAGNQDAIAFQRALQLSGFDQLDPEHRARVIQALQDDPEEVDAVNALPKVAAAIAATAPAGVPEKQEITVGDQLLTRMVDPVTGEVVEEFTAPRFKADRPRVFEVDGQLVDETGRVVFEGAGGGVDPVTLSEGAMLVDPRTGQMIAENPKAPGAGAAQWTPHTVFDEETGREVRGALNKFTGEFRPLGGVEAPDAGTTRNASLTTVKMPDGSFRTFDRSDPALIDAINNGAIEVPGGSTISELKTTEGERSAAGYLHRMRSAEEIIGGLEGTGYRPGLGSKIADMLPIDAGNFFRTPEGQRYRQAAMDWIRAKLRKESGAQIAADEFEGEFQTYFPQPGDSPEVVEQKRAARKRAEESMAIEAGRATDLAPTGTPGARPAPGAAEAPAAPSSAAAAPAGDVTPQSIATMDESALSMIDIDTLSPEALDALEARYRELGLLE